MIFELCFVSYWSRQAQHSNTSTNFTCDTFAILDKQKIYTSTKRTEESNHG